MKQLNEMPSVRADHEFDIFVSAFVCLLECLLVWVLGCLEILSEIHMNEKNKLQIIISKVLIFLNSNHTKTYNEKKSFVLHNSKPPDYFSVV